MTVNRLFICLLNLLLVCACKLELTAGDPTGGSYNFGNIPPGEQAVYRTGLINISPGSAQNITIFLESQKPVCPVSDVEESEPSGDSVDSPTAPGCPSPSIDGWFQLSGNCLTRNAMAENETCDLEIIVPSSLGQYPMHDFLVVTYTSNGQPEEPLRLELIAERKALPPSLNVTANGILNPASLELYNNEPINLSWDSGEASRCIAQSSYDSFNGEIPLSGERVFAPGYDGVVYFQCQGPGGP